MSAPIIISRPHKSAGVAIILTLLLGPLGLFYATITGGLIMTFILPIGLFVLVIVGYVQEDAALFGFSLGLVLFFALTYWLINLIWAVVAVQNYNSEVDKDAKRELDIWNRVYSKEQPNVVVNISQGKGETVFSKDLPKPPLQDWLRSNPGKSINDYFGRFGR